MGPGLQVRGEVENGLESVKIGYSYSGWRGGVEEVGWDLQCASGEIEAGKR